MSFDTNLISQLPLITVFHMNAWNRTTCSCHISIWCQILFPTHCFIFLSKYLKVIPIRYFFHRRCDLLIVVFFLTDVYSFYHRFSLNYISFHHLQALYFRTCFFFLKKYHLKFFEYLYMYSYMKNKLFLYQ